MSIPRPDISQTLIYAIGDVHGRADLLETLLGFVESDAAEHGREPLVIFLGDIIDRGPDSRAAMDLAAAALDRWPSSRLMLGNHDDWLLRFLAGASDVEDWFDAWLTQGGRETLLSYGTDPSDRRGARETILECHPRHAALLIEASILECMPHLAFVHAGIDPQKPFDAQARGDCLKIRAPFLGHVGRLDHIVVHGHSPQRPARPVVTENRISMDTGAVFSGVLSAVVIDADAMRLRFAAARVDGSAGPIEPVLLHRGFGTALDVFGRG